MFADSESVEIISGVFRRPLVKAGEEPPSPITKNGRLRYDKSL